MFGINMSTLACLSLVYYVILVSAYNDVDENFSYENLAKNRTGLKIHLDCFMNKGPCDDTAAHYKIYCGPRACDADLPPFLKAESLSVSGLYRDHIKDAVWNDCQNCSTHHRHNAHAFLSAIEKEFPEETVEFKKMYDKDGAHFKSMEDLVDRY